jgi:hypothetical protein
VIASIKGKDADVILMCLPRSAFSYGSLPDSVGDPGIPLILLAQNPDLILIDANFAAALRANGANVLFAISQEQALEMLKTVAALKMLGPGASSLPYRLRDYHGMGQGIVPEVEFPVGIDVLTGSFTKDLKSFLLWPGKIQVGTKTDEPTNKPSSPAGFRRMTCSNYMELKIRDVDRFLQNIPGIHQIVITGNHSQAIRDALLAMNVGIIGPSDHSAPDLNRKQG